MSYFAKAKSRLKLLPLLLADHNYSDMIRESQEIVELAQKGMLRQMGIEPPKWHYVCKLLISYEGRFPESICPHMPRMAEISKWLRKERELAFYGDIDFIPSEEYTEEDAQRAIDDAAFVVKNMTI